MLQNLIYLQTHKHAKKVRLLAQNRWLSVLQITQQRNPQNDSQHANRSNTHSVHPNACHKLHGGRNNLPLQRAP
jgi:hypothetical protein